MRLLRTFLLFAAVLLCADAGIAQPAPEKLSYRVPEETWKAEVKGFDNASSFKLEDARGKVILLEVWAYYFRPGREGLEEFRKIQKEFAGQNLEVIGISLDRSRESLERFLEKKEVPWVQMYDEEIQKDRGWNHPMAQYYGIQGIPTSILVDRTGNVVSLHARGEELGKLLEQLIEPAK